ncbi:unnamed protein product [Adineta ricciae]|uniref:AB hydrolase-1 domain-containing protein n=1 Tax=Adineta ricciae TaxID=249248 RepID=A0A814SE93_ADIRI|nr:unnamed protein product [Adineta ricciae]CAF1146912.1 unnamed protein product [Adineta ricciae]
MTSPLRSKTKKKKAIRRVSKSPQRRYSPERVRTSIQVDFQEFAYSDPVDSSRSLLPNVLFERHDQDTLSEQATKLFNSTVVFDETERAWLLENMCSTTISIKVDHLVFSINGNYALKENQQTVLFLHGFGAGRNWANWLKLAYPLSQQGRYSTIFVDLPGFGQSSGRSLDQASWKRYGPEILVAIVSSFHLHHSIYVVAQCGKYKKIIFYISSNCSLYTGGAATTVRTINRYPQWFRNRNLIFCNSVIGDFGEEKVGDFEITLTRFNIYIVVFWTPDEDHTKYCVAYKRWNRLRASSFRNLQLIDLDPKTQTKKLHYPLVSVAQMSRCPLKNKALVYKLSDEYIQQIIDILDRK